MQADSATFWEHIEDLRTLLVRCMAVIFIGFILCFTLHKPLFNTLLSPIHNEGVIVKKEVYNASNAAVTIEGKKLQPGETLSLSSSDPKSSLVILSPLEGMTTVLKLSFWAGLVLTSPVWLYYLFLFISPALEAPARAIIIPFITLLLLFGGLGLLFASWFTIPLANHFLAAFNAGLGQNFWSLGHYVDYSILLLLSHALIFESAALLLLLVHMGTISAEALSSKRRYAYLVMFIGAAIMTPPDIFTQISLGVPMVGMYELIILYGRMRSKSLSYNV